MTCSDVMQRSWEGVIGVEGVRMLGRVGDGSRVISREVGGHRSMGILIPFMIGLVILYFCSRIWCMIICSHTSIPHPMFTGFIPISSSIVV